MTHFQGSVWVHGLWLMDMGWTVSPGLVLPGPPCHCVLPQGALSVPPFLSPGGTHTRSTLHCRVPYIPLLRQNWGFLLTPEPTGASRWVGAPPPQALKPHQPLLLPGLVPNPEDPLLTLFWLGAAR